MHQVSAVDNDIAGRDFHAAMPCLWWIWAGEKANYLATGPYCANTDSRQTFMCTLQPKPVQANLRQLGAKISPRGWKELQIRSTYRRLIRKRVRETKDFAPSHCVPHLSGWTI